MKMKIYQRTTMVKAIQFYENDFYKDSLRYPMVFDRAMFSELWAGKGAEDGRYYVVNQPNTYTLSSESMTVNDGDYIVAEQGFFCIFPQDIFEKNYEEFDEAENRTFEDWMR